MSHMMNIEDAVERVKVIPIQNLISITETLSGTGRWLKGIEKSSLVVDTEENKFYWNAAGESGDIITWVMDHLPLNPVSLEIDKANGQTGCKFTTALAFLEKLLSGSAPQNYLYKPVQKEKIFPSIQKATEYHNNLLKDAEAQAKWHDRGIGEWHWNKWMLGYKYNHWGRGPALSIPFFEDGELKTIRHRIINPVDSRRYLPELEGSGSWVFNIDILKEKPKELWIIEGEIKYLVASSYDISGIAISGIQILPDRYLEQLGQCEKIYVCPDPVINPKKIITPYDIGWMKRLASFTEVRLVLTLDKIDDFLMQSVDAYKALMAAKRFSSLVRF
jgi:hypothetical protein